MVVTSQLFHLWGFIFLIFKIDFYWSIVDLQCCVSFCFIAKWISYYRCFSVVKSCLTLCDPHGPQHTRIPCLSLSPGACSISCPLSRWCHATISSSAIPFSSCLQSFPASESFPMSQFFTPGGQSIGLSASASIFPKNIQDWFPLGLTGFISLLSKGLFW